MGEIFNNVFKESKGAAQSVGDVALVKLPIAGTFAYILQNHGTALLAFVVLILIDLATKWLAVSHKFLTDNGMCQEDAGLWKCLLGMRKAFKGKYITSEMMKTKFAGKLVLYMLLVAAAVHIDVMTGGEGVFLRAAWYYLAATEGVSIIENLRDAGVQGLDPLLVFIRSKLGGLK